LIKDKKLSRLDFLKLLGVGTSVIIFNVFPLPRIFRSIFGQSDLYLSPQTMNNSTTSTVARPQLVTSTFKVGINNDTFGGGETYGMDMGYNQFSGQKLYDESLSIDLSKPDPAPPVPYITKNPQAIELLLQQIQGWTSKDVFI
jgi:hypothetical protein